MLDRSSDAVTNIRDERPASMGNEPGRAEAPPRLEREFRRARRHSTLVRILRISLPVLAVLILLAAGAKTWLARLIPDDMSLANVTVSDGRIVMEAPRLSGFDSHDQPYWMVADKAYQSVGDGRIDLEGVRANLSLTDGTTVDISATKGQFDPEKQTLSLDDKITVRTSSGMTAEMQHADVNIAKNELTGQGPVEITTQSQTVHAGSLKVAGGGKLLSFGDRVKMTLLPEKTDTPSQPGAGSR
ncbi:LPS export ABC transporter periplasmic protein LptC [Consotaella salsifontis]|uniref:Lipopolysaccharide export system protein LptC n=1 Tax=Consotaella salsifontis TaxID=1365950 RepID=A0A1T4QGY1_9HYPH|nr:LPS export ABC transporter periplasmic protein LptC [Consotaella salsifontis]SKA02979.1 lipopolysaccharide export system protein LptC [Consotaella salsifontis]